MKDSTISNNSSAEEIIEWARVNYYSKSEETRALLNSITSEDSLIMANKYNILGILDMYDSDYRACGISLKKAIEIAEKHNYKDLKAKIYLNFCSLNERLDNLPEAIAYAFKVFSTGYDLVYGSTYYIIARINFHLGNVEKSKEYLNESIKAYKKRDDPAIFHVYFLRSEMLKGSEDYENALASYKHTLKHLEGTNMDMFRPATLNEIGHTLMLLDRPSEGIPYIEKGIHEAEKYNIARDKFLGYLRMAECYKAMGDFSKADEFLEKFFEDENEKAGNAKYYRYAYEFKVDLYKDYAPENVNEAYDDLIQHLINGEIEEKEKVHKEYLTLKDNELKEIKIKSDEILKQNNELRYISKLLAHDLKTPVRTIGSFTSLLRKSNKDKFDTESKEFSEFISQGAMEIYKKLDLTEKYLNLALATLSDQVSLQEVFSEVHQKTFTDQINLKTKGNVTLDSADIRLLSLAVEILLKQLTVLESQEKTTLTLDSSENETGKMFRISDSTNSICKEKLWAKEIFISHDGEVSEGLLFFDKVIELHGGKLECNDQENSLDIVFEKRVSG